MILWSLGNESGYGTNHDALAGWIRRADPTRPLHYEDAIRIEGWDDGGGAATDVVCPMYPEIEDDPRLRRATAPAHVRSSCASTAMRWATRNGSLADYWDTITSTPGLQGGFIWEWKDHGLRQRSPDGTDRLAYGGQFGDEPNDGNFVADGLVSADLEPHPAMREVAWVYRPVVVSSTRGGLRIENRQSFRDLSDLRRDWELLVGDEVVESGTLEPPLVAPHAGDHGPAPARGFAAAHACRDCSRCAGRPPRTVGTPAGSPRRVGPGRDRPRCGAGRRHRADDPRLDALAEAPRPNLWRAPTDNDGFKLMPAACRATRCRWTSAPALAGRRRRPPARRRARRP